MECSRSHPIEFGSARAALSISTPTDRASRHFYLPLNKSAGPALTFYWLNGRERIGKERLQLMRTARLLVVEDNPDILEMLTLLLSEKYSVSSCGSAAEALTVLEASRPDVLMLDIRMSPVDGTECLEAIRAIPGYSRIPAIALTACAHEAEKQAFLAAGFQAVVTKPILDLPELEVVIDTLLNAAASVSTSSPEPPSARIRCGSERPVSVNP